jgi:hypothetical protein
MPDNQPVLLWQPAPCLKPSRRAAHHERGNPPSALKLGLRLQRVRALGAHDPFWEEAARGAGRWRAWWGAAQGSRRRPPRMGWARSGPRARAHAAAPRLKAPAPHLKAHRTAGSSASSFTVEVSSGSVFLGRTWRLSCMMLSAWQGEGGGAGAAAAVERGARFALIRERGGPRLGATPRAPQPLPAALPRRCPCSSQSSPQRHVLVTQQPTKPAGALGPPPPKSHPPPPCVSSSSTCRWSRARRSGASSRRGSCPGCAWRGSPA